MGRFYIQADTVCDIPDKDHPDEFEQFCRLYGFKLGKHGVEKRVAWSDVHGVVNFSAFDRLVIIEGQQILTDHGAVKEIPNAVSEMEYSELQEAISDFDEKVLRATEE